MQFKRMQIIINPAAGNNEPMLNILNDVLKNYDIAWDVSVTQAAGDGAVYARQAVEAGCDIVAAYGGDGTQLDVAEGLLNTDVPLAILPGGTANALADELSIPPLLENAAHLIGNGTGEIRAIDVGKTGDKHFLLRVGTGMVATFSENVTRELKDRFGIVAYIIGGINALTTPQYVNYKLTIDGALIETQGAACLITNGNAIGALKIRLSEQVHINDGLLDVFILNNDLKTVVTMASRIVNLNDMAVSLQHWQGREIMLESDPPQGIYGDGEEVSFAETPSTTRVLPGALKVLMPKDAPPL
jgi:diacylglycerol kinase (ATP)